MKFLELLATGINSLTKKSASSSGGYDAGAFGRRAQGWNASKLGSNTLLLSKQPQIIARSRDAVRNSPIAKSAIDKFESNIIGSGIVPHFLYGTGDNPADLDIRKRIQDAWNKWTKESDYMGQLSFYGQQALLTRELFEAGECFARFYIQSDGSLQVQLIESEQLPIYTNTQQSLWSKGATKLGIVFDDNDKRAGYNFYRGQPYDSIINPQDATQFIFVDVDDCLHVMKPLRAGQLRGEPMMTSVLALLFEIEQYSDAERVRKKVASMFAAFITKLNLSDEALPIDTTSGLTADPGTEIGKLEAGTIQALLPGEDIKFPTLPEASDYASFMYEELHKFASGVGLTYEQLTGNLKGVNYSSIRAGVLEFRRSAEQFQSNVIINGFCEPVMKRWMREAVLSGALQLPDDYFDDSTPYEMCTWVAPGWAWVDPVKEINAYLQATRAGFTSRTQVVRETGKDPEVIDQQSADERARAKKLGLVYDSDPNVVLIGKETVQTDPNEIKEDDEDGSDAESE